MDPTKASIYHSIIWAIVVVAVFVGCSLVWTHEMEHGSDNSVKIQQIKQEK